MSEIPGQMSLFELPVLPTPKCTEGLHEKHGGACFWCCDTCNYDNHRCHFCGDFLRHDNLMPDGSINFCYANCECGHIGHEHFANSCRGSEITYLGTVVESDCDCTELRPVLSDPS